MLSGRKGVSGNRNCVSRGSEAGNLAARPGKGKQFVLVTIKHSLKGVMGISLIKAHSSWKVSEMRADMIRTVSGRICLA